MSAQRDGLRFSVLPGGRRVRKEVIVAVEAVDVAIQRIDRGEDFFIERDVELVHEGTGTRAFTRQRNTHDRRPLRIRDVKVRQVLREQTWGLDVAGRE